MSAFRRYRSVGALLILLLTVATTGAQSSDRPFDLAIEAAVQRVVKLYGAKIGRQHAYGSGVLVSSQGDIITALSIMIEGRTLRAVLHDGRQFPAKVVSRDERRQIARIKIDAANLPYFELTASDHVREGDWLIAAGNSFKVAHGDEDVSVWAGVLSSRTNLNARRRTQEYPYTGPVLIVDAIVTTPGMAGGALVDLEGRLVGLIGNPVTSNLTNTWLNYAIPVEQVRAFVENGPLPAADRPGQAAAEKSGVRPYLGLRLFELGGRLKPAYVDRVRPRSPAKKAGVRKNDLIVAIDGRLVATCSDYHEQFAALQPGQEIEITVKRKDELRIIKLTVGAKATRRSEP